MDARSIAELILDEHPQIIALVISYLDFGLGADVLGQLPEDSKPTLSLVLQPYRQCSRMHFANGLLCSVNLRLTPRCVPHRLAV